MSNKSLFFRSHPYLLFLVLCTPFFTVTAFYSFISQSEPPLPIGIGTGSLAMLGAFFLFYFMQGMLTKEQARLIEHFSGKEKRIILDSIVETYHQSNSEEVLKRLQKSSVEGKIKYLTEVCKFSEKDLQSTETVHKFLTTPEY